MKKQLSLLLFTTLTLFSATTNKDFTLKDGKGVIMSEPTNTFSTKIKSSDSLNTNIVLTLPDSTPEDNQILVVDSNGNLSWADNNATAGSDNQKVDKFVLEGNQIKLSLESDAEADKVIDLSSITAFLKASDIKDNLTSTDTNKALSAKQGKELKALVDALNSSLSNHTSRTDNPHSVTKAQVGLANVDNTSDLNKPISTATQDAINNLDTKVTDINQSLSSKITDLNNSQSDNQAVDVLDFNGTHLTISLDNNDTNKTIYLDRNISSLSDINTTSLTDGQVLRYDNTTKTWSPFTLPEGTTVVDELNSTSTNQALSANQGKVLNTKISDVNGSVNSLTTTVSTNTVNITTLTSNLTDVNSSVTSQESKINDINQTVQINKQNITDLNNSLNQNTNKISSLESNLTELNTTVSSNTDNITTLNTKVDDINNSITSHDSKITELNTTIQTNKTNISDINSSLHDINSTLSSKINDLNNSQSDTKNAINDINQTVQINKQNITDLNNSLNQNTNKISSLESNLTELNTTVSSNTDNITTLNTKVDDINNSITSHDSKITELNTTIQTNKTNISDINSSLYVELNTKVNTSDIVDNLTSTDTNKTLSANQGKVLKGLIEDVNSSATLWSESDGNITRMSGRVGIGTLNPQSTLDLGSGSFGRNLSFAKYVNFGAEYSSANLILGRMVKPILGAHGLQYSYDGNATPSVLALTVNGEFRFATDIKAERAVGTAFDLNANTKFIVKNNGNVGIGTQTPSQKLDIKGNIALEDTNSTETGVIYKDGVPFIHNFSHPTGDGAKPTGYNTFIGKNAGNFSMGEDVNETYHSSYNTAVGFNSLRKNTTGYYNTAQGVYNLCYNTTGYFNTAQGVYALFKNTTGKYNTAQGVNSLYSNKSGSYNTAIGNEAGKGVEDSSDITGNSLFGYRSGFGLKTGANYNTLLGYKAGYNIETGENNIIIGKNIDAPDANGSNQLNIGNVIYSDDMTTKKIGIGTPTPQANLHVSSGTNGDATLIIESDTDNDNEYDNPSIRFLQDGGSVDGVIGLVGENGEIFTDSLYNSLYISSDTDANRPIQFVTGQKARVTIDGRGNVGIGTKAPARTLHIKDVLRLEPRSSAPDNPSEGDIYMDSTNHKLKVYDGTNWQACW